VGGAARRIPARPAARLAGEVGENDRELTTGLLVVDLGSGASPARGYDGDRRRQPLEVPLRRTGGSGGPTSERGSFVGARER
jgi:hypothetical protein